MLNNCPPPARCGNRTHQFSESEHNGYVTVASDGNGRPIHLEIRVSWGGCVLRGLLESLAVSVLIGLQRELLLAALAGATTACTLPRPSFGRWRSPAGFRPFVA